MNSIMTIEEKAARYDKAIEIAKKINNEHQAQPFNVMTRVFPELKESEDEKIRKELLESFKYQQRESRTDKEWLNGIKLSEVVAWLEKQGGHLENYDEAEKEKYDFVSGQYIQCRASFNEFKEYNSYWLEYIGNDTYIGRSDNILNQKFHITPRQLYRLFSQQHFSKEDNTNDETNAPTEYGKYVDECLNEASKHFFSEGEDKYSVADLFYAGVRCGKSWLEKQGRYKFEHVDDNATKVYKNEDGTHFNVSQLEKVAKKEPNPAWSLAALLKLIKSEIYGETIYGDTITYKVDFRKYKLTDDVDLYQIAYGSIKFDVDGQYSFKDMVNTGQKEDPIDAAFEMVVWLKENNKI